MFIGKPVPPASLIDREKIVDKLVKDLANNKINSSFALLGYRRVGKTSILLKVKQELERKGLIVVYFDVKERATDPEGFLNDLESELLHAYAAHLSKFQRAKQTARGMGKGIAEKLTGLIASVKDIGVEISPAGTITPKIKLGEKSENDFANSFRSVFKTANIISDRSEKRVVLIFDEFQDLLRLKEFKGLRNILDLYRGALQKRGDVSHVVSGSRVHMLRNIFEEPGSPLFQHFIPLTIGNLDDSSAMELFNSIVDKRDIEVRNEGTKFAKEAISLVGGHPYYIILLAESWDGKTSLDQVFEHLISAPTGSIYIYANYVLAEDLGQAIGGPLLKKIVKIIAQEGKPIESSELARRVGKSQNYLQAYLQHLIEYDLIIRVDRGLYKLVDPVIATCIAKNSV